MKQEIKPINKRLSTYRRLAGYTQQTAAEALGMKKNTYARMELHGNPTYDMIIRLASLYNVSANLILYGAEEKNEIKTDPGVKPDDRTLHIPITEPQGGRLEERPQIFNRSNELVLSVNEKNCIRAVRTFTKGQQKEIMALINKFYKENKGNG